MGIGRPTTVELEPEDTAQRLTLRDPVTGKRAELFCLPLGENPTAYDRYLVRNTFRHSRSASSFPRSRVHRLTHLPPKQLFQKEQVGQVALERIG